MKIIGVIQYDVTHFPEGLLPSKPRNGDTPLQRLTNSMLSVKEFGSVFVAMPDNPENRQFAQTLETLGIKPFWGSTEPALRLFALGMDMKADALFRVPADLGNFDPGIAEKMIALFTEEKADLCFDEISSLENFFELARVDAIGKFLLYKKIGVSGECYHRHYQWMLGHPAIVKIVSTCPKGTETLCAEKNRIAWHHRMDLGGGINTRGLSDHRENMLYRLPKRMDGERVADVGSFDGVYAFEAERRGAREVYSFDIPDGVPHDLGKGKAFEAQNSRLANTTRLMEIKDPVGKNRGFDFAHGVYRSKVKREYCNIYDLSAEKYGTFDRVLCFALLLHLLKPMLALEKLAEICSGTLHLHTYVNDAYGDAPVMWFYETAHDRGYQDNTSWWLPSTECLKQMLRTVGFREVHLLRTFGAQGKNDQADLLAVR